jgi:hypothetical protein
MTADSSPAPDMVYPSLLQLSNGDATRVPKEVGSGPILTLPTERRKCEGDRQAQQWCSNKQASRQAKQHKKKRQDLWISYIQMLFRRGPCELWGATTGPAVQLALTARLGTWTRTRRDLAS